MSASEIREKIIALLDDFDRDKLKTILIFLLHFR